jgi:glyoxylase-like metal-dependent hydrolase (beta-lactamase superfamily II)
VERPIDRRSLIVAGAGVLAGVSVLRHAEAASAKVTTSPLGERLTLISGAGGNVLALSSGTELLLVDTGLAKHTRALQSALKPLAGGAKVTTVINTHWHDDHTGGNDTFGKSGAIIIAHAKARQRMAVDQYVPSENRYLASRRKEALPAKVFYRGKESLLFGQEHIEYGYLLEAHTDGDLYVYFRDANVIAVGDAAAPHADPVLAWYEGGWLGGRIDAMKLLLALGNEQTRYVPGDGAPVTKVELKTELDALETVFTRMSESIRKGLTTEDMQKAEILADLPRTWADADRFVYDAHKGMWAHHNKLSHSIV